MLKVWDEKTQQSRLYSSQTPDHDQLRGSTLTLFHTKFQYVLAKVHLAQHDLPAISWPWSTSCHGSGPCHGSWWDSSFPEHPQWWAWTYGRPPHRSAGQQGSPRTLGPWDHQRRFLKDWKQWQFWVTSSHHWIQKLDVFNKLKFIWFIKILQFHYFF